MRKTAWFKVIGLIFVGLLIFYMVSSSSNSPTLSDIQNSIEKIGEGQSIIMEDILIIKTDVNKLVIKDSLMQEQLLNYTNPVIIIPIVKK